MGAVQRCVRQHCCSRRRSLSASAASMATSLEFFPIEAILSASAIWCGAISMVMKGLIQYAKTHSWVYSQTQRTRRSVGSGTSSKVRGSMHCTPTLHFYNNAKKALHANANSWQGGTQLLQVCEQLCLVAETKTLCSLKTAYTLVVMFTKRVRR